MSDISNDTTVELTAPTEPLSGGGSKPRPTAAKSPFGDWNLADEGRLRCCCPRLQSPGNGNNGLHPNSPTYAQDVADLLERIRPLPKPSAESNDEFNRRT